jgi:hypothetical protein
MLVVAVALVVEHQHALPAQAVLVVVEMVELLQQPELLELLT